jgi:hypothetical protein
MGNRKNILDIIGNTPMKNKERLSRIKEVERLDKVYSKKNRVRYKKRVQKWKTMDETNYGKDYVNKTFLKRNLINKKLTRG